MNTRQRFRVNLVLAACFAAIFAPAAQGAERVKSWADLLDAVKADPRLEAARAAFVAQAREAADLPIIRRARTLEEVGTHRTWYDGRARYLEPEIAETFALAMSDFGACNRLATELPLLAAAYRLTGEDVFRERVLEQLVEMSSWSPLQRPGWTCFAPGHRLPPDGKDGNWLATGTGVRAIADTLELMPEGSVDAELRARLHVLLAAEIAGVVDDWKTKRSWFIRSDNPITNQWVLPTEGLVRACLVLGPDAHRDAYELGVANTLKALDAHGPAGEFEEGVGYASVTLASMLHAAHAMAVAGDPRALDHRYLQRFPTWLVHNIQPGRMLVNCFDAGRARAVENLRPLLSLLAVATGSPVARWALADQVSGPSDDVAGLLSRALPPVGAGAAPPLHAAYEHAARVNWRDSWSDDATGIWVRGGHPLDQHDHYDRGHVNLIFRGRPILIEAGTPSYDNPLLGSHYASLVGHNVLQLGSAAGRKAAAPITVHRLDDAGGDLTVDPTACYDDLEHWRRKVTWTAKALTVTDRVALADGKQETVVFRWHLGTADRVEIAGSGDAFTVRWPDATITLSGSAALEVSQEMLPDNTLEAPSTKGDSPDYLHTCVVVRSRDPVGALELTTAVEPRDQP